MKKYRYLRCYLVNPWAERAPLTAWLPQLANHPHWSVPHHSDWKHSQMFSKINTNINIHRAQHIYFVKCLLPLAYGLLLRGCSKLGRNQVVLLMAQVPFSLPSALVHAGICMYMDVFTALSQRLQDSCAWCSENTLRVMGEVKLVAYLSTHTSNGGV